MPECQRFGYAQEVADAARKNPALANEVYVQVMKQLTNNPSQHSELKGWKLMLLLCQQVCPGKDLDDFVHTFLLISVRSEFPEAADMARQCIGDLNLTTSPEKAKDEAGDDEVVPIQVMLINGSVRKIHTPENNTLEQIGIIMAKQLRITEAKDFAFFQLTDGLELHRLLPDGTILSQLTKKWSKLKDSTGRASRLLYKRRFLRVDEALHPGELMHATLTFRQAIWDFLHYPIREDPVFVCEIAAHILSIELDHFDEYLKKGRLDEPGVLEQLLPVVSLKEEPKLHKWSGRVLQRYHDLSSSLENLSEPKLARMSRTFALLQRMKLFGAYCWVGRQTTSDIPADMVSIENAPAEILKLNPKEPEAEYWICVDFFGVRFISVDSTGGKGFQRGFQFNEESVERILYWGAKQNYVQFVVSTVNKENMAAGRVPLTVNMISPPAVDIAYAVHVIHRHGTKGA